MGVLDELTASSRADALEREQSVPHDKLLARLETAAPTLDPLPRFRDTGSGIAVISEVKRSSPSRGTLAPIDDPAGLARLYQAGGAAAISVLTEPRRFGGSLADLMAVRDAVTVPVLRKDFMSTRYQLLEARVAGADLVLLIVAALSDPELRDLYDFALSLSLTPLVEVHTAEETRRAVGLGAALIGVNNRNLQTLEVDTQQFGRLAALIPDGVVKVAESGLQTIGDVVMVHRQGADAVLIGEALVRDNDPTGAIAAMLAATGPGADRQEENT